MDRLVHTRLSFFEFFTRFHSSFLFLPSNVSIRWFHTDIQTLSAKCFRDTRFNISTPNQRLVAPSARREMTQKTETKLKFVFSTRNIFHAFPRASSFAKRPKTIDVENTPPRSWLTQNKMVIERGQIIYIGNA